MQIQGRLFEAIGTGGPTADLLGGCGLGGTTSVSGPAAIGNPHFRLSLTGVRGALGVVLVVDAFPAVNPIVRCGTCTVLAGVVTQSPNRFDASAGTASAPVPIPCESALIGGQLQAQWLVVNLAANPCPIVPGISASNRLGITIGQ
jgi:hypothetical protein